MIMMYKYVGSQVILETAEMTKKIKQPEKKFKVPYTDFIMKTTDFIVKTTMLEQQ